MARRVKLSKAEADKERQMLELERKYDAPRRTSALLSWLLFILALAVAGAVVYYALFDNGQFSRLWYRATHPDTVPAQIQPGQ